MLAIKDEMNGIATLHYKDMLEMMNHLVLGYEYPAVGKQGYRGISTLSRP